MYLTDDDMIAGLKKCIDNLTTSEDTGDSGLIVIKENVTENHADTVLYIDKEDNSCVRSPKHYRRAFEAAGLEILHCSVTEGWAPECYDLMMWVCRKKKE